MKTEKLRPEQYDCFSEDDRATIGEGDFSREEREAIAGHNAAVKAERCARTAIAKEATRLVSVRAAAAMYPLPDLSSISIRPSDPWAELPAIAATLTSRLAHPLGAPPQDWILLRRESRELLAGLIAAVVGAFERNPARARERRDSIRDVIGVALLIAPEDETDRPHLREALDPRMRRVVDDLSAKLNSTTWSRALADVDKHYLRRHDLVFILIAKIDEGVPGILDRAIAALRRSLLGEPEPAPAEKPRTSSWETTREAERTAESAAKKILARGRN